MGVRIEDECLKDVGVFCENLNGVLAGILGLAGLMFSMNWNVGFCFWIWCWVRVPFEKIYLKIGIPSKFSTRMMVVRNFLRSCWNPSDVILKWWI